MKNLRAFHVKYIGPTDTKGSRIRIRDLRRRKTLFISTHDERLDDTQMDISLMLIPFFKSKGIDIIGRSEADSLKGYIMLTDNFDIDIK
jgi:hypothetical protein